MASPIAPIGVVSVSPVARRRPAHRPDSSRWARRTTVRHSNLRVARLTSPRRCLVGDGLVAVRSALGRHRNAARTLPIPARRPRICYSLGHIEMLGSREVYEQVRDWCSLRGSD
jgi:hypothetical protein